MLKRVVTGVVASATTLVCLLWSEPWGLWALLALLLALGTWELVRMTRNMLDWVFAALLMSISLIFFIGEGPPHLVAAIFFVLGTIGLIIWRPNQISYNFTISGWLVSGLYAALVLGSTWVSTSGGLSVRLILLALVPLWIGDSMAYFVGSRYGKHLIAPSVSPKKSWEGAIANFVGCMLTSILLSNWIGLSVISGIAIGLSTGVLGQIGDFLQSRVKRLSGVKDSGSLLPGHGGVLDRADSFLFSVPPSLLLLLALEPQLFHVKQLPF